MSDFILGLDLGQSADYTALSICRAARTTNRFVDRAGELREEIKGPPVYEFSHIQRFALGTPYPQIVRELKKMVKDSRLAAGYTIVCDATGVGMPVVDLLFEAGLVTLPITITGGSAPGAWVNGSMHVAKRDLVSTLAVLFQSQRVKFAAGLPEVPTLVSELLNFKVKISQAGRDSYEAWREGIHDDLVLACALAVWHGERGKIRMDVF